MKIELTPEISAALAKYAELAGQPPAEFLNRYLNDSMVPLFENPRSGELESHLATLEYHTRSDAERVVAWMANRIAGRSGGRTAFEAEIFEDPDSGGNHIQQRGALLHLDCRRKIFSTQNLFQESRFLADSCDQGIRLW